ncbi:MAG: hypothetical protein JO153_13620 [Solirubrobacterales bacterium]|nr:hypothetical protein [Solirubrobacterales bacterium]
MLAAPNRLRWRGQAGHYEVYYLTLTDPASGIGLWIRYTMLAPSASPAEAATASLWLAAMDPRAGRTSTITRKTTLPIAALQSRGEPFELRIDGATLSDSGMTGGFEDVAWDLRWDDSGRGYEHVSPVLRRAGIAKTILVLPHADLRIDGSVSLPDERLEVRQARGGQAHLWGSKHASRWAWAHCNDFVLTDGKPAAPGTFVDAVSVILPRFGRQVGPSTPVLARIEGRDFESTSPLRVIANDSTFALTGWRFEAIDGERKLVGEVDADRRLLAGVTYTDPDGERAYCYNSETASMRLHLYERAPRVGGWALRDTFVANGRAHFEYGQRDEVPGLELLTR